MTSRKELKTRSKEQLRGQWKVPVLITLLVTILNTFVVFVSNLYSDNDLMFFVFNLLSIIISLSFIIMINSFYLKVSRVKKIKFSDILISWKTYFKSLVVELLNILITVPVIIVILVIFIIIALVSGVMGMMFSNSIMTNTFMNYYDSSAIISFIIMLIILTIVLCIPIIILGLYLFPSVILMCEDNNRGVWECIKLSFKLMKGNAWRLFVLQLSFIGWNILCALPIAFAAVWVIISITIFRNETLMNLFQNQGLSTVFFSVMGIGYLWLTPYMNTTYLNFYNEISGYSSNDTTCNDITYLS